MLDSYNLILKWSAGASISLNPKLKYDERRLIQLIDLHGLSGRFVSRVKNENVNYFSRSFINKVEHKHQTIKQKIKLNIIAIRRLNRMLPSNIYTVVIKGISTYVVVHKKEIIRAGDVDILSNKLNYIIKSLKADGYTLTKNPFLHESGEYSKNGVEFDLHKYFPVCRYSKKLKSLSKKGILKHNDSSLLYERISFKDIYKDSYLDKSYSETKNIRVVDISLLAVIICSHAFMNYVNMWSISHRKKTCIRLGELADLAMCCKHKDFNHKKFIGYVNKYQAYDSVEWAARVCKLLFGYNPLPLRLRDGDQNGNILYPRCIWWNFWALFPLNNSLLQDNWMPIEELAKILGANTVSMNSKRGAGKLSTTNANYLLNGTKLIDPKINFKYERGKLDIQIEFNKDKDTLIERLRVDFGKNAIEYEFIGKSKKSSIVGDRTFIVKFKNLKNKYIANFSIKTNKKRLLKGIPLIIGFAKHNYSREMYGSQLIPFFLHL